MQQIKAAVLTPRSKYREKDIDWVLCCQWLCQNVPTNHDLFSILPFKQKSTLGGARQSFSPSLQFLSCLTNATIYKTVGEILSISIGDDSDVFEDDFSANFYNSLLDTLAENGICLPSVDAASLLRGDIDVEAHCALTKAIMQIHLRSIFSNDMVPKNSTNISEKGSLVSWADVELTLTSWLNEIIKQVNEYVKHRPVPPTDDSLLRVEGVLSSIDLSSSSDCQRSRRWECAIPLVDDIYQDISDGQCLAAIFAFYFPRLLSPHEIRVKSLMGFSDCLHNLSIVIHFCTTDALYDYCPDISKLWLLSTEEIIYSNWTLRAHVINALVLLYVNLRSLPLSQTLMHEGTKALDVDENNRETLVELSPKHLGHDTYEVESVGSNKYGSNEEQRSISINSNEENIKETSSMSSRYSNRGNSSLDPAGDALVELEARWRPKSSFANHQIGTHRERSYHAGDIEFEHGNTLPKYRNFNQSSNIERISLKSGRDPSEDSAIGTLSTNSEAGFSHISDVPRRRPKSQPINDQPTSRPCSFTVEIATSPGSNEMSDSNYNKTYSRKTSRTGQQRMSIQNILDSPLGNDMNSSGVTIKPLSAMKNDKPVSNIPPKPVRTSNPFGQSQQQSQTKNRPKSAMGERFNSQIMLYSEDSDEEPISEPESLLEKGSRTAHATTSNGKMNAIKLKMEEKRKNIQIERARLEAARQKQRQKMGKTAFMRVMRNPDAEKSTGGDNSEETVSEEEQSFTDHSSTDPTLRSDNRAKRTLSDKVSERRGRAKSIQLENFDPNAIDRVSQQMRDVQTSTNLPRQQSEQQKYPHRFSSRPNSVHERDVMAMREMEWSGGRESSQSTLKRNKPAQIRPLTRMSDQFSESEQRSLTLPNYVSSSVDLRNSLERDMLIEHNQLLARELETLKQRFAVELETRKLQSEREQFELQRQMESQQQPLHIQNHQSPHQSSHVAPPYWTMPPTSAAGGAVAGMHQMQQTANAKVPLNMSHNATNFMYGANHGQQQYVSANGSASPFMPGGGASHLANQKVQQPIPFYAYQPPQPPYATQDQEMYQHYETTHRQEYNYDTLHGTHHNFYQQPYQGQQVPPPMNVPPSQNHPGLRDLADARSRSFHDGLVREARPIEQTVFMQNPSDVQQHRPNTLPVIPTTENFQKSDSLESELCTLLSPMDPNAEVSSSVEVTPENSPRHEQKHRAPSSTIKSSASGKDFSKSDLSEGMPKENVQPANRSQRKSSLMDDQPINTDSGRASKKGEAFSINFGNSDCKSPRMEIGLGKSSPKLPRKLVANKSRTLTKVKSRQDNTEDTPAQDISRSNSRLSSNSGANNLDEALKIVRDSGAKEPKEAVAGKKKGALALVIDVEALGSETGGDSPVRKGGEADEAKRKEREQEFLRRQMEKKQKDLERRKKATEVANMEGQERLMKEMQQKQQMKQEALARRERIMAQYLQKKAEKELEENGMAATVPRGSIGGGSRGFMVVGSADTKTQGVNGMKPRAKSRSKSTVATEVKPNRSRRGSQKSPANMSRSRRNSIENLVSDGTESVVSALDKDQWDGRSETSEYSGPKLFGKPSSKSNKQKIQNAITQCVFPGAVNSEMKQKILNEMDAGNESNSGVVVDTRHFLILFRDHSLKYRGLYLCEGDCSDGEISKVIGIGPSNVKLSMIQDLYKYDSGGKKFVQIPSKTMAVSVDAFTIHNQLWKKK